jgi:hypothetical protein
MSERRKFVVQEVFSVEGLRKKRDSALLKGGVH